MAYVVNGDDSCEMERISMLTSACKLVVLTIYWKGSDRWLMRAGNTLGNFNA